MMKKSLIALAVLGTMAGISSAGEVVLYGTIDYGMQFQHYDGSLDASIYHFEEADPGMLLSNNARAYHKIRKSYEFNSDRFGLDSGLNEESRVGISGTEELGNGYSIAFRLETGFNADDGSYADDDRIFDREAQLSVVAPWGTLSFGRMGALSSATGTYDKVFAIGDAFDGGDNDVFSMAHTRVYDNMVTYQSPKYRGLQATAQYSFKTDSATKIGDLKIAEYLGREGHRSANRYAGLAVTGEYGAFEAVASYEQIMLSTLLPGSELGRAIDFGDAKIASLGANYDFGVVKTFAMGQYFKSAPLQVLGIDAVLPITDGYAFHIGAQAPVCNGILTAGVYYSDADDSLIDVASVETIAAAVKYEYPLSPRTSLYASVGYGTAEFEVAIPENYDLTVDADLDLTQAYFGITHKF